MLQRVSSFESINTDGAQLASKKVVNMLFSKIKELKINISHGGTDLHDFLLSCIGNMQMTSDLIYFLTLLGDSIGSTNQVLDPSIQLLYRKILKELILKKRHILQSHEGWSSANISFVFRAFANIRIMPHSFLEDMIQLINRTHRWNPLFIATILKATEPYNTTIHNRKIISILLDKVSQLDLESQSFKGIQALIISLEHLDIDVPNDLLNRWNTLQNEEGHLNYTQTKDEDHIFQMILDDYTFEGFSLERNVYICGYEVDIVMYDVQGNIFAIIESDGEQHSSDKVRRKDQKRDNLFLRRGISDIIIRCKKKKARVGSA